MRRQLFFLGKLAALSLFAAGDLFCIYIAALDKNWFITTILSLTLIGAAYIYLSPRAQASKFFYPGVVLLIIFMILPMIYTLYLSALTYKDGNLITKSDAIQKILTQSGNAPDPRNITYFTVIGSEGASTAELFTDQSTHQVYLGENGKAVPLTKGSYKVDADGNAISVPGFTPLTNDQINNDANTLTAIQDYIDPSHAIVIQDPQTSVLTIQTLSYNAKTDTFTNTQNGKVYVDNHKGNFTNIKDPTDQLLPGWKSFAGLKNFTGILSNPKIRGPFIKVLIWTVVFAFLTVVMQFLFGMFIALALEEKLRGKSIYRFIIILPYAMPSFMSILIWGGIFNANYGQLNVLLGTHIQWLNTAWLARGAVLLVNLWLGFPYFYLISTGALKSFPKELEEAAEIDGASPTQITYRIKMPIILKMLAPLLISSFAFNFNNFNLIYLLTQGGPTNVLAGQSAGATDILITYAYKVAFSPNNQDYGIASAISVLVFIIIGTISVISLRRSSVLKELQ